MTNATAPTRRLTIGIDLGDRRSHLAILDRSTGEMTRKVIPTVPASFAEFFGQCPRDSLVALEASTHARWAKTLLEGLEHRVLVADPRKFRLIAESTKKTDENDAEITCVVADAIPELLNPVELRSDQAQQDLEILHARELLVRQRAQAIAHVRTVVKGTGARLKGCSTATFHKQAPAQIPQSLRPSLLPLVAIVEAMTQQIAAFDKEVEQVAKARYPDATKQLQQVAGVGPLTSLAFTLVVGDLRRFAKLRSVPAYLGLAPGSRDSGKSKPQLPISRNGNELARRLLVTSAQYILGPFGPDSALRRWGQQLVDRGGSHAKQRAVVAVARKLAFLLATLLRSGEPYDPLRGVPADAEPAAPDAAGLKQPA